jgi:hypothetical protein
MKSRIVFIVVLAAVIALVGGCAGWSTNAPEAVGEAPTVTSADERAGAELDVRPKTSPHKGSPPKGSPPKGSRPKACSPTAVAQLVQLVAYTTPLGQEAETEPASPPQEGADPSSDTTPAGEELETNPAPPPQEGADPSSDTTPAGEEAGTEPAPPQEGADPVRFGAVAATPSDGSLTDIADDGRAFTTGFWDRNVAVDGTKSQCDPTRSFSVTLPLTDGAKGETLRVYVLGYGIASKGARARLTLRLNGQVKVKEFRAGSDEEFLMTLELPASPATTYQLSGVLEAHRDPSTGGTAILQVSSIESEIS